MMMEDTTTLEIVARHNGYSPKLGIEEFKALCVAYNLEIEKILQLKNELLVSYFLNWTKDSIKAIRLIFNRIVMTQSVFHVLYREYHPNIEKIDVKYIMDVINTIDFVHYLNEDCTFAVRCTHVGEFNNLDKIKKLCRKLEPKIAGPIIRKSNAKVDLENPLFTIKCFFSAEGDFIVSMKLAEVRPRKELKQRNPSRRKYFHPSAMRTPLARTLVNLTALKNGDLIFDPFNGSGGLLLEAADMSLLCLGQDMNKWMLRGAKENLEYFKSKKQLRGLICGDSTFQCIKKDSIDGIATDPPYGTSSSVTGEENTLALVSQFFKVARKILKKDKRFVICTPNTAFESNLPSDFIVLNTIRLRIHRSLTRKISILKKIK